MQAYPDKNYIDLVDFREAGYFQEVNRLFFHPLGLALELQQMSDESWRLSGIWDVRDDKEGIVFNDDYTASGEAAKKAEFIRQQLAKRAGPREKKLGFVVQPVGEDF